MSKTCFSNLASVTVALTSLLFLYACGQSETPAEAPAVGTHTSEQAGVAGTYTLDRELFVAAALDSQKQALIKANEALGEAFPLSEEAEKEADAEAEREIEALIAAQEPAVREMAEEMEFTLQLDPDGTFTFLVRMPSEEADTAEGTWELQGDRVTLRPTQATDPELAEESVLQVEKGSLRVEGVVLRKEP